VSSSANVQGLDHVEFYVGDAQRAASSLCASFGFRLDEEGGADRALAGGRSPLLRQGDIRIVLSSGATAGSKASDYVSRHGDGVAIIALAADDVGRACAHAVRHGATPVSEPVTLTHDGVRTVVATVSGFGDVVHRLVERHEPAGGPMPETAELTGGDMLRTIDHVAVCLPPGHLRPVVRFYEEAFGFAQVFEERIELGEQTMDSVVVQDSGRQATFTLLEPGRGCPGQISDFLRRHGGPGVQHLAFGTRDIASAVRDIASRGVSFLSTPDSYYDALEQRLGRPDIPVGRLRSLGILADRDHGGQMFQIFSRSTHPRQTFFFELIERHGAVTFGSANIKALYEAVERADARERANA